MRKLKAALKTMLVTAALAALIEAICVLCYMGSGYIGGPVVWVIATVLFYPTILVSGLFLPSAPSATVGDLIALLIGFVQFYLLILLWRKLRDWRAKKQGLAGKGA